MSFGSLSPNAILALNAGAKKGGFAHDTGEGGVSPYHREHGGDIIWEIGSGYFGCRTSKGLFDPERFRRDGGESSDQDDRDQDEPGREARTWRRAAGRQGQCRDRGHSGHSEGVDCISPSAHSAFSTPLELIGFIAELRRLSGGKPIGFKLCVGQPWEFFGICKAMLETGLRPDFIVVDGKEGGTGAAPLEFMDHLGMPMREGLTFVHDALLGVGLRDQIRIGVSGKIITAFDIARAMALGADWCNSARGFMFALGCIQSLSCHTDRCPTGVATQDPLRARSLDVPDKAERVYSFHRATLVALAELTAAVGIDHPEDMKPRHFCRRLSPYEVATFADLYPEPAPGAFLAGGIPPRFAPAWNSSRADTFRI